MSGGGGAQSDADLWVVTDLSVALFGPPPEGEKHPETVPVGPFPSREEADAWALAHVRKFLSGSWSIAPLTPPYSVTSPGETNA